LPFPTELSSCSAGKMRTSAREMANEDDLLNIPE
jgi:hypothetical protein